ncbi:N-formylglutamate deformylase [Stappia sp. GBMRC 2046]|uniref:N-formylglutamate deformylase n=1 Tax=Stappia sediminis TaxID=2692190 RepID=A0A7X3LSQ1_9HYPH|nr:N-formylglutamate amidohydrolase [Stappia sediminis]MXN64407.1 N-formylglutamate deformylase [Stappia sediminis]
MDSITTIEGSSHIVLSIPHAGRVSPDGLEGRLHSLRRAELETDIHLERLVPLAAEAGVSVVMSNVLRSVVDVNRPPNGEALYPDRPPSDPLLQSTFDGLPIWRPDQAPDAQERGMLMRDVFWPYHEALKLALDRARRAHGTALLLDAHSIRSLVPSVSPDPLPDVCLGSNRYASADMRTVTCIANVVRAHGLECSTDEHFLGGYVTRNAGEPQNGVHAVCVETAKRVYLDEADQWAEPVRMNVLLELYRAFLEALATLKPVSPTSVNEGKNI